jgi:peptide/nickel transport system substrate-binding protein
MKCSHALRQFAKTTTSLLIFSLAFAACTRTHQASPGRGNAWTQRGVLRIASGETPDNLNTLLGTQVVDTDIGMLWAAYLLRFNDRNQFVPELALAVPMQANGGISADGLRITYRLRRGVKWQDGAPFTAADVLYTWRQMLNPNNAVVSRVGYDVISRIDAPDPYTIVVRLKRRFAPFVATFFAPANHTNCILPAHLLKRYRDLNHAAYNDLPVGTGPFKIVRYVPGVEIEFVANDSYWRGAPKLRRIDYRIVQSESTLLTLLQSHAVDLDFRADESQAPSLHGIAGTRVVLTPETRFADLGFNAGSPILADGHVRRALAYATNRPMLIQKVMHGVAIPARTDQPPFSWAYDPHAVNYRYDLQRARGLLDAAGWRMGSDGIRVKNGKPLRLELVSFTGSPTISATEVLVQQMWRQAGVDVYIKNYNSSELYSTLSAGGIEQSGKFDVIVENWANGTDPDDSILVRCDMAPPNGWNVYHFCSRALDAAETTAITSYNRAVRKGAYDRIQSVLQRQLPFFVLWYVQQIDVVNTDFRGYKPAHAVTPFWNPWEWSI